MDYLPQSFAILALELLYSSACNLPLPGFNDPRGIAMTASALYWFCAISGICCLVLLLRGLHKLCIYLEDRNLLYYRRRPKGCSPVASALFELDRVTRPSIQYTLEVDDTQKIIKSEIGGD
jgi:hypothetical protein